MACPTNLAVNGQTRMLADLALVGCYNTSAMPVASAKTNLERMAYFGLTEQQRASQYMFEETFNLRFKESFEQVEVGDTRSGHTEEELDPAVIARIKELNKLDMELHRFATKLLLQRYRSLAASDEHYSEHMERR